MKKLSWILISAGLIFILIPVGGRTYMEYRKNALLEQFKNEKSMQAESDYISLQHAFEETADAGDGKNSQEKTTGQSTAEQGDTKKKLAEQNSAEQNSVEHKPAEQKAVDQKLAEQRKEEPAYTLLGRIIIEKIGVDIPVVEGVKPEQLKVGAGHIPGTSALGEVGNSALAGHRSYTFGLFFNRLNEVEVGDQIVVETKNSTYRFKVYKKHIVEPDDTSILKASKTEKVLTLITCEPIYIASHRLIIHARAY